MKKNSRLGIAALAGLFIVDRMTKVLALHLGERALIPFVVLRPVTNSGIAFSLPLPPMVATVLVAILVVVLLAIAVRRFVRDPSWFAWALVAVGGLANLFDRFRYGAVIDFVAIGPLPVFNVADVVILIGILRLAFPRLTSRPVVR